MSPRIIPHTGRRIAGASIPWGQTVVIDASMVGQPRAELVRASIGGPCLWQFVAVLDGAVVGDTVQIFARPGLGAAGVIVPIGPLSSVAPVLSFPGSGIPATELELSFQATGLAFGSTPRLTIVACPLTWPAWASPETVNGP